MANEIRNHFNDRNATFYCTIKTASGTIWHTGSGAFLSEQTNLQANYKIAMTRLSGDVWAATHPSGITSGTMYTYSFWKQAGSAANKGLDTFLDSVSGTWDSSGVVYGTDIVFLSPYAYCSLADIDQELTITDNNYVKSLINAESQAMDSALGRKIVARDYVEHVQIRRTGIRLNEYPVISVDKFSYGSGDGIEVVYSGTGFRATVQVHDNVVELQSYDISGQRTKNTFSVDTYMSASTLTTAISGVTGWYATLKNNCLSEDIYPIVSKSCKNSGVMLCYSNTELSEQPIISDAGFVYNTNPPLPNICLVKYRAGYETVPDDLKQIIVQNVKDVSSAQGTPNGVSKVTLGDYSYTLGKEGQVDPTKVSLADTTIATIKKYKRVVIG